MNVLPVLELLRLKIGLNPESIGIDSVEKTVLAHMKVSGVVSVDDYIRKLKECPTELKKLVESVVVSETSFFRNKIPFLTLKDYLKRFILNKRPSRPIRILCLPCATGEEAYSIAMVLFDLKLSAHQFHIYAGDISEHVLQFARQGLYRPYSFRGDDLDFRSTYFAKQGDDYILKHEIRDAVQFEYINILADDFLPGHKPYDIIFCRNLLIYFDDDTKEKAIKALTGRLAEEGVLFVGHAEGAKIPQFGYASLDYPMSFAFARKAYAKVINGAINGTNPAALITNRPQSKSFTPPLAPLSYPAIKPQPFSATHRKISPVTSDPDSNVEHEVAPIKSQGEEALALARELAANGSFGEVMAVCEKLLAAGVESAEVYYLFGQAVESTGNSLMAEEYLKKAIYLDADFHDALMYLSLLYGRLGSPDKAAIFRKRAQRVKLRNS